MTLLGNYVEMSGQEGHEPFIWDKRSKRSMRGKDPCSPQEGKGSRAASSAVHTPSIHALFSLFSCPDKISQQSHKSAPTLSLRSFAYNYFIHSKRLFLLKDTYRCIILFAT